MTNTAVAAKIACTWASRWSGLEDIPIKLGEITGREGETRNELFARTLSHYEDATIITFLEDGIPVDQYPVQRVRNPFYNPPTGKDLGNQGTKR